jgi:ketosteroid isomerase-like protein
MTFRETLDRHLAAIQHRDLPALADTVAAGRLSLILGDGRLVESGEQFLALHKEWFKSPTWSLETKILHVTEGSDLALALIRMSYRDQPAGREPIHETSYLTLGFQRGGDRWLMVHNQNTPVQKPASRAA